MSSVQGLGQLHSWQFRNCIKIVTLITIIIFILFLKVDFQLQHHLPLNSDQEHNKIMIFFPEELCTQSTEKAKQCLIFFFLWKTSAHTFEVLMYSFLLLSFSAIIDYFQGMLTKEIKVHHIIPQIRIVLIQSAKSIIKRRGLWLITQGC